MSIHVFSKFPFDGLVQERRNSWKWNHSECNGISNHQPHHCLPNRSFKRKSKKTSKLWVTGLWRAIHRSPVNSPHKWPVRQKMSPFDDVMSSVLAMKLLLSCTNSWKWNLKNNPSIYFVQALKSSSSQNAIFVALCIPALKDEKTMQHILFMVYEYLLFKFWFEKQIYFQIPYLINESPQKHVIDLVIQVAINKWAININLYIMNTRQHSTVFINHHLCFLPLKNMHHVAGSPSPLSFTEGDHCLWWHHQMEIFSV